MSSSLIRADMELPYSTVIEELDKPAGGGLGARLHINNKGYADLDQVAAELFKPMMLKVHEILRHNKCRGHSREALGTSLRKCSD
jgi:hypothetical protein